MNKANNRPVSNFIPRPSFLILLISIVLFSGTSLAGDPRFLTNKEYFTALEDKIKQAREEVLVSMFIFRTTDNRQNLAVRLRETLVAAASRGVRVTVVLEKEGRERKGSSLNYDNADTARLLTKGGVKVFFDTPGTTTHTKLVVIDNRFVFIGSHNFTDSALRFNNEASVMIDSPKMAREASSFIKGIE